MHRACTRLRQRNPDLFVVGSFFAAGEQGAWYDPSDLNTLFQDDAGTVPVTASGQTVGRMLDKSGNGHHAVQTVAGSRPTFRDVNGLRYLEFDGVDDFLLTNNINLSGTDKITVFAGAQKPSDATRSVVAELSVIYSTSGAFALEAPGAGLNNFNFGTGIGAGATFDRNWTVAAPISAVLTCAADFTAKSQSIRGNGVLRSSGTHAGTAAVFANQPLYIGRRAGTTFPFGGQLYGLIIRGAITTAADVSQTERYLAAKTGVALS